MKRKTMSLKAKIRNLARKKETPAQVVLQNYMFERFLERLSVSTYKDKFIVYALAKTQNLEQSVFNEALRATAIHRETTHIFDNIDDRLKEISASESLRSRWIKYTKIIGTQQESTTMIFWSLSGH